MKHLFTFSSNSEKLSRRDWIITGIIIVGVFCFIPILWQKIEKFNLTTDYRLPYNLSNDYWMFDQWCKRASLKYQVFIIGDSVIWGQYVKREDTLSHYLNELAEKDIFANMGVDGLHPVAMLGLIKYYGKDISKKGVILQLNPLWMHSKKYDLQGKKEFRFHHPRLVPQLFPNLACYKPSLSERVGVVAERNISFFSLLNHIKVNYFDNMAIQNWTLQNPYKDPLRAITLEIPILENKPMSEPISWIEKGMKEQNFLWIDVEKSFQWSSFKKAIKILNSRKNRVFILLGPFNTHMLTEESLSRYNIMRDRLEKWLKENKVSYSSVPTLPSKYYADSSHTLKEGYRKIAEELFENSSFQEWMKNLNKRK